MGPLHRLMDKLLERTKSLFWFRHAIVNYIGFMLATLICIIGFLPLSFGGATGEITRIFLASVSFSLMHFYAYQGDYESRKDQKYVRYRGVLFKRERYRAVLLRLIFFKSLMFVPIFMWILFSIGLMIFNYRWSSGF